MADHVGTRLGDLLDGAGARFGMDQTRRIGVVWRKWREIVGPEVAAHAQPSSLRKGVLRVRADSPAWANEIKYLGEEIRSRANEVAGSDVVSEVRLWVGTRDREGPSPPSEVRVAPPPPPPRERLSDPTEAVARARSVWLRSRSRNGPT